MIRLQGHNILNVELWHARIVTIAMLWQLINYDDDYYADAGITSAPSLTVFER